MRCNATTHVKATAKQNQTQKLCSPRIGDPVQIISSPFASVSPELFRNIIKGGIISNALGDDLYLLDCSLHPGSEGGAVIDQHRRLIGMALAPPSLSKEFGVAVNLSAMLRSEPSQRIMQGAYAQAYAQAYAKPTPKPTPKAGKSLACIDAGGLRWGSGILVDCTKGRGLLLATCAHIVSPLPSYLRVRFDACMDQWHAARVVAECKGYNDVAFLRVEAMAEDLRHVAPVELARSVAAQGQWIAVMGHGVFGPSKNMQSSVSAGIVSKVIREAIVQTSARVFSRTLRRHAPRQARQVCWNGDLEWKRRRAGLSYCQL